MSAPSLNEALALMNQQAYAAAANICRQYLASHSEDFNAHHLLGLIQFKSGDLLNATRELEKASSLPVDKRFKAQALSNLALVLQARNRLDDAGTALQQAVQLQPNELAFHLNLLGLLEKRGDWPTLLHHLQQHSALQYHPEARLYQAVALRHQQQPEQATALLEVALNSTEAEAEWSLNLCLLGQPDRVIRYAREQHYPAEWLIRVADYMAEEGLPRLATPIYGAALQQAPDNACARHMLDAAAGHCTEQAPAEYVSQLYDAHADAFEERLQQRLGYRAPELIADRLAALTRNQTTHTLLDLGCGTGLCGQALRQVLSPTRLIGCDLSPRMLEHAADKAVYDELIQGDLISVLVDHAAIDLITAADVLIYIGNLKPVLSATFQSLKPGGLLALTIETCPDPNAVELDASGRYRHNPEQLQQAAQEAGFATEVLERFPLRREHDAMLEGALLILRRPG